MYRLIITKSAEHDLKSIFIYGRETFGLNQAESYQNKILLVLNKIAKMPTIGHTRNDLALNYLSYKIKEHTVIYKVDNVTQTVIIARFLHGRMDIRNKSI